MPIMAVVLISFRYVLRPFKKAKDLLNSGELFIITKVCANRKFCLKPQIPLRFAVENGKSLALRYKLFLKLALYEKKISVVLKC